MSFLPGLFPAGVLKSGVVAAVTTLSQVASATSTASTITGPAGIQAGDLLVLWDVCEDIATIFGPAFVIPAGFTPIIDQPQAPTSRAVLSYKIANGSEASASLTGMNGSTNGKMLYVFRGDVPITQASVGDLWGESNINNPASQLVAAGSGVAPLIVFGGYRSTAAVDPRTFSTTKDGEISSATTRFLAYKIYNSSPADSSIDMDDEGNNVLASCYLVPRLLANPFPQVPNVTQSTTDDGVDDDPIVVGLPAGIASGDLLIATIALEAAAARSINTPTGWTQLFHTTGGGNLRAFAGYYRVADGSEGTTQNFDLSGTAQFVAICHRIKAGTYQGTPEAATTATGSSTSADPPSLTPSWGSDDNLWLACMAFAGNGSITAHPTNYKINVQSLATTIGAVVLAAATARRDLTAASENPGAFTHTSLQWAANTIAIRGA